MKKRFKKSAFFMAVVGFIVFGITVWAGYQQYQIITTGQEIGAKVTKIISITNDDGTTYKPEVTYLDNGEKKKYVPSWSSSANRYVVGDPVTLIVSNHGTTLKGSHGNLLGIILGAVLGLGFMIGGIIWFRSYRKHFDEVHRLKRYGNVVKAQFIRKESTNHRVGGNAGEILFFQEIDGKRIFNTHPIFSEFSVKWLEEHPFDVYVDPTNDAKYFVDMEKLFGHPISS